MPAILANRPRRPRAPGELLQVGPDNPAASNRALRQANQLMEEQDFDQAEAILRRLVAENTRDPEPLASLAICVAAGRGNLATAEKLAERARKLAPGRGCGWFALGYVNLLGSRLERGYRYLEEGRRRDPKDPRLQFGQQVLEERRPGMISDLSRHNPLNRLLDGARRVATDHRVMTAGAVYAFYRAAFFLMSRG
jgi:tetratricopeptide (TPR) repeat protein